MNQVCFNGRFLHAGTPLFSSANRGFRYGDGLFETMKVLRGRVLLFDLHCQRLQQGLHQLGISAGIMDFKKMEQEIIELCRLNGCTEAARVRWAVYRQEDGSAGYVLEAERLGPEAFEWQEQGWTLALYTENRKGGGPLANLKSANYLLYLLAAAHAKAQGVDECLVLNEAGNICDGSRTNIFLVKGGALHTPALHQGCVAGLLRRYLLEACTKQGIQVVEGIISEADLFSADEVFVTNAVQGMRWVRLYGKKSYSFHFCQALFNQTLATIYR